MRQTFLVTVEVDERAVLVRQQIQRLLAMEPEEALSRVNPHGRPLAYLVLQAHSNHEYEGMEIEPLEVA